MDVRGVLEHQTVLVRDQRIAAIGDVARVPVPPASARIDGRGRYLLPGLVDMHVHYNDPRYTTLFLANGVTTVRNMWGAPAHLRSRDAIASGAALAPAIYTCGPITDGDPPVWEGSIVVRTAAEAEAAVAGQAAAGYDFIKVYDSLALDAYDGVMRAAQRHGIRVVGHVPLAVGLSHALAAGQASIEHLTGYLLALQSDDSPHRPTPVPAQRYTIGRYAERERIPEVVASTLAAGAWNCVTLVVLEKTSRLDGYSALREAPELRYLPPALVDGWDPAKDFRFKDTTPAAFDDMRTGVDVRRELTRALHEAGARILLGTDTPNPFVVPGFSIHEELRLLVDAGLTPYEALRAGTAAAAEFLHGSDEFGSVREGLRADLVLAEANPLDDVANAARRAGVMVRGRWLPEAELRSMLDDLAQAIHAPAASA